MTRSERALWHMLKRELGRYGLLERREDRAGYARPDVLYLLRPDAKVEIGTAGQIELKVVKNWPVRPGTPVRVDHPARFARQAAYAARWWAGGGWAWVLLQAGADYALLPGYAAPDLASGKLARSGVVAAAWVHTEGVFPTLHLRRALACPTEMIVERAKKALASAPRNDHNPH